MLGLGTPITGDRRVQHVRTAAIKRTAHGNDEAFYRPMTGTRNQVAH